MAHPAFLREKARALRTQGRMSVDEIADRLDLPKTTIYYWVRDLPLVRARRATPGQRRGNRGMVRKYQQLREEAYAEGQREFASLTEDPTFRDFVCLYIADGHKRQRNTVALGNSDPKVVALAARWIRAFSRNPVRFSSSTTQTRTRMSSELSGRRSWPSSRARSTFSESRTAIS
jgi:AcrR family transcriptional regulator